MIVNVKYAHDDGSVYGRAYSYRTKLRLRPGDRVLCPTSSGTRRGVVDAVDVPESAVDPDVLPLLREIVHTEPQPVTVQAEEGWDEAPTEAQAPPVPDAPSMEGLVRVAQLPVIEERLRQIKSYAEGLAADAAGMVATEETVQAVKARRAELSRMFKELEEQRKAVKNAVLAPYSAFESVYKECVNAPFSAADASLKAKIDAVESEQKARCEERLRAWFAETAQVHSVGWLKWEQTGVKVDLTSAKQKTPQKLMDRLNEIASKVALDVEAISKMADAVEVMIEYKKSLNLAASVSIVRDRHEAEEKERIAAEARKEAEAAQKEAEAKVEAAATEILRPPVQAEEGKDLRSAQDDRKVYKCSFTVRATKDQLRALKNFMKQEGISYE